MGKHKEWRKTAKKLRRSRLRKARAKERDLKILEAQRKLQNSPHYQQWLKEENLLEQQREEEEKRQSDLNEQHWREVEEEAQKQWKQLQVKMKLAREEKMKQNMKIKLEWEKEQQRLNDLRIAKEKELEEKEKIQKEHERQLLDFLEHGGTTPEHLKMPFETNPGKQICPFFQKVSACRFFDTCSRNHVRPGISKVIVIPNFFSDISLEAKENEHGSDSSLEFEREDTYAHYKDFFYDVVSELEKCGHIRNFYTCCNHESHLRGNVYVEYKSTRDALVTYHKFNGRWYGGRQINVYFCKIDDWKLAICGLFFRNKCPKGNSCNFLHVFINPKNLYNHHGDDNGRKLKKDKIRHRLQTGNSESWDSHSERRSWRWSESPEPFLKSGDESMTKHQSRSEFSKKKRDRDSHHNANRHKHSRSRSKSRNKSSRKSRNKRHRSSSRSKK